MYNILLIITVKYEKINEVFLGQDKQLAREYLSKIKNGSYLHKYSGLWALGLDMLPSTAQRFINLFVYRDCGCSINVWVW